MRGAGFAHGRCTRVLMLGKLPFWVVPVLGLWPCQRVMLAMGKQQRLPLAEAGASSPGPTFLCVHMFLLLLLLQEEKISFLLRKLVPRAPRQAGG